MTAPSEKHFGTKDFIALIRDKYLSTLTVWRFQKDRADGVAPEPVAKYGNRDLFVESQAGPYVQKLLERERLEPARKAAQRAA